MTIVFQVQCWLEVEGRLHGEDLRSWTRVVFTLTHTITVVRIKYFQAHFLHTLIGLFSEPRVNLM